MGNKLPILLSSIELNVGQGEFDVCVAVVGIDLWFVCDVEKFGFEQFLLQLSEPESDAADRRRIVGYRKLQMIASGTDSAGRRRKANAFGGEDRFGIALAERAEQLKLVDGFFSERIQRGHCVDV